MLLARGCQEHVHGLAVRWATRHVGMHGAYTGEETWREGLRPYGREACLGLAFREVGLQFGCWTTALGPGPSIIGPRKYTSKTNKNGLKQALS